MNSTSRSTAASVLVAVSLVVCLVGGALLAWSQAGLTAHLFLPPSKWLEPAPLAPLGPASTAGLRPGLRVVRETGGLGEQPPTVEVLEGLGAIRYRWAPPLVTRWRGYLEVDRPGLYHFGIWGTQNATLALDGRMLGGFHAPWHLRDVPLSDDILIALEPGLHTLAIDHWARDRPLARARLGVNWTPPGGKVERIPPARLWSETTGLAWSQRHAAPHLPPDAPERAAYSPGHLAGVPKTWLEVRNSQAFYAHFANTWDFRRFRLMHHFPGYEVLWRGRLRVSERRVHRLEAESDAALRLQIGGAAAEVPAGAGKLSWSGDLAPGWHDFSVSFVSPWERTTLRLSWDGEGEELAPISASRLRPLPADRSWFAGRRWLGWTVLGLGLAGLLLAAAWLRWERALRAADLRLGLRRGAYPLALCLIMLLGAGLRLYRYSETPGLLVSSDELHNARKGWHLLHGEGLRAWTPIRYLGFYDAEQIEVEQWSDIRWSRVRPNFDRPPLFPLLLGLFDTVVDPAESIWALRPSRFRLFPILLAVLSIPLVAALSRRVYGGRGPALLAALLFAAVPVVVLNHRQAKSDLLVVVFVLIGLLAAFRHLDTGRRRWLWAAAAAAGLATWSKEIGVIAVAIVPFVWLRRRRWREGLTVACTAGGIFALYFVWGSLVDFEIFWKIVRGQAAQASGFHAAWLFLTEARLVQTVLPFAAGWTLWLWFCVAYASRRDELPALAAVCFLILTSATVRIEWIFGWYWVPMYPFLCMAGGLFLYDMLRRPNLVRGALFVLTVIFMSVSALRGGGVEPVAVTRGALAVSLLPFALVTFFPQRHLVWAGRLWAVLVLVAALALGAYQLSQVQ